RREAAFLVPLSHGQSLTIQPVLPLSSRLPAQFKHSCGMETGTIKNRSPLGSGGTTAGFKKPKSRRGVARVVKSTAGVTPCEYTVETTAPEAGKQERAKARRGAMAQAEL